MLCIGGPTRRGFEQNNSACQRLSTWYSKSPPVKVPDSVDSLKPLPRSYSSLNTLPGWNRPMPYDTKIFGVGRDGWQITSTDEALRARLEASGITGVLAMLGTPELKFDTDLQTLTFSNDITPNLVLTPSEFVDVLELLLRMKAA